MPTITHLNPNSAILLWNKFISSLPSHIPSSFNPSLFYFYTQYFHWKPYYFLLYVEDKPVAALPLVYTGHRWVSLPHFSYGGFAVTHNVSFDFDEKLIQKLIFLIRKEGLNPGFFQLDLLRISNLQVVRERFFIRTTYVFHPDDACKKVSSLISLPQTKEELYKQLNANLRRKINKAANSGFELQIGGKELIPLFYDIYAQKMHQLGSPAYGKDFFEMLMETYRFGETKVFLVMESGKTIGASFSLSYMGFYESSWFATNEIAYKKYVSDYLHWQMMQYAISQGATTYSFGRSTPQGSVHIYKNHWPVTDIPIYQYEQGRRLHAKNHSWIPIVWKHIPYFITRPVDPLLVKHIY